MRNKLLALIATCAILSGCTIVRASLAPYKLVTKCINSEEPKQNIYTDQMPAQRIVYSVCTSEPMENTNNNDSL